MQYYENNVGSVAITVGTNIVVLIDGREVKKQLQQSQV